MEKKSLKQFKIALVAVLMTVLILTAGFVSVYKKTKQDLQNKDYKISVLVDEVGQLKDQNEKIITLIGTENKNFDQLKSGTTKLQTLQTGINNLLGERKKLISELIKEKNTPQANNTTSTENQNINILILGIHNQLTDTIILADINPKTHKNTLISIPRDIFFNGRKINELYLKYGIGELEKAVIKITGIAPNKYIIFNMDSFVTIVNILGGVDMNVPKNIVDASYPGPNNTYQTVSFKKGPQHFDGEKALKYARSRESTSDFDRSLRQQQLIQNLKEKVKELNLIDNMVTTAKIYEKVKDKIATNINFIEALLYLKNYSGFEIQNGNVLTTSNYLYSTTNTAGQYILLPRKKDFSEVQKYIQDLIAR